MKMKCIMNLNKNWLWIYSHYFLLFSLFFIMLPETSSPAQVDSARTILLIQQVKVHSPNPVKIKFGKLHDQYKNRPLHPEITNKIKQAILRRFYDNAYYLAGVDSVQIEKFQSQHKANLQFYVHPGIRFMLAKAHLEMPDSLRNKFSEKWQEVQDEYLGKPYTDPIQKRMFGSLVEILENNGYPLSRIETKGFTIDSLSETRREVELFLKIHTGPLVQLSGLKIPAGSHINPRYLERIFRFHKGEIYDGRRIQRYYKQLQREDFIKSASAPQIIMDDDSSFYLSLDFEEASTTSLDGVVGYVPPPVNNRGANGYFTGQLNLGLRNVFGTGRRLDVFWQKPDRFSDNFRVKYREPFVLGLPFHAGVEMHRLVRDTTYLDWEYAASAEVPLNENLDGIVKLYQRQVYPDSLASVRLRLPRTRALHTEMGLRWDTRDNLRNPRTGLFMSVLFDYGTQRNVGPAFLLTEDSLVARSEVTKITSQLALFLEFWNKQVLAFNLNIVLIGYQGQPVRPPDMFWFGGATTIRGYREQQFFGEKVGWLNTEYRFLLGPQSRFFVFVDWGYYSHNLPEYKEEYLTGYGLGIRFPGPLGALQVDYGLARGAPFREGKIHFRLINEF